MLESASGHIKLDSCLKVQADTSGRIHLGSRFSKRPFRITPSKGLAGAGNNDTLAMDPAMMRSTSPLVSWRRSNPNSIICRIWALKGLKHSIRARTVWACTAGMLRKPRTRTRSEATPMTKPAIHPLCCKTNQYVGNRAPQSLWEYLQSQGNKRTRRTPSPLPPDIGSRQRTGELSARRARNLDPRGLEIFHAFVLSVSLQSGDDVRAMEAAQQLVILRPCRIAPCASRQGVDHAFSEA